MLNNMIPYIIGAVTGTANGFFGAGGGTVLVPAMERLMDVEEHKAHATAIAVILPLSVISAFLYRENVKANYSTLLMVSLGGIVGGYIGARLLGRIPKKWLHIIFGGFMITAAARMIL